MKNKILLLLVITSTSINAANINDWAPSTHIELLANVLSSWGTNNAAFDFNNDSTINNSDLSIVLLAMQRAKDAAQAREATLLPSNIDLRIMYYKIWQAHDDPNIDFYVVWSDWWERDQRQLQIAYDPNFTDLYANEVITGFQKYLKFNRSERRTTAPFRLYIRMRKLAGHGFNFPDFFDLSRFSGIENLQSDYAWSKTIQVYVINQPSFALDNSDYFDVDPDNIWGWRRSRPLNDPNRWVSQFSQTTGNRVNNPTVHALDIERQFNTRPQPTKRRGYSTLIMGDKSYTTKPAAKPTNKNLGKPTRKPVITIKQQQDQIKSMRAKYNSFKQSKWYKKSTSAQPPANKNVDKRKKSPLTGKLVKWETAKVHNLERWNPTKQRFERYGKNNDVWKIWSESQNKYMQPGRWVK